MLGSDQVNTAACLYSFRMGLGLVHSDDDDAGGCAQQHMRDSCCGVRGLHADVMVLNVVT
jgi:hypothetical protein